MHDLADFFSLVETMFARMLERVKATQRWLRDETTEILVVTSVSDDGAQMARGLIDALSAARLAPCAVIVNRAAPVGLAGQRGALELAAASDLGAAPVVRYALAYAAIQARVVEAAEGLAPKIVIVPDARGLDGDGRLGVSHADRADPSSCARIGGATFGRRRHGSHRRLASTRATHRRREQEPLGRHHDRRSA